MLFERQKRLLGLVASLGGDVGGIDFQKLLFLFTLEEEKAPSFEFVPYRFGGFSFTSYADKRRLIDQGLLSDEEKRWMLTDVGRAEVKKRPGAERFQMDRFARRYQGSRGDALGASIYRKYPYFAIRSEIASRLLVDDATALRAIEAARPSRKEPALFTIGYEGSSLEGYLNRLLRSGVSLLCDVRRNALSRKYGFSRSALAGSCEKVGIRYEHLPELGIASDRRRTLESRADYDALFEDYEREDLPEQAPALERIAEWVRGKEMRVALTCFEAKPEECHRHCVAEELESRFGCSFRAKHL